MTREEAQIIIGNIPITQETMDNCYSVTEYQMAKTMAVKALEQESMREFTKEESKAYSKALDKIYKPTGFNVFNEPCGDSVSRQAVINLVRGCNSALEEPRIFNCHNAGVKFEQYITELPSVQPKAKKGHWIELPKALNPNENPCKCSECGHILSFMNYYPKSNYCPNCGAEMKGGAEK